MAVVRGLSASGEVEVLASLVHDVFELCFGTSAILGTYYLFKSERKEVSMLRRLADRDELTSLHNRAFLRRAAGRRIEQSRERGFPLSCIMLDVDNFKPYNDEFGHESGDEALRCVARVLRELARADDIMARYGGEEFVVIANSDLEDSSKAAERIRGEIEHRCCPELNASLKRQLTVSLGIASLTGETRTLEQLVEAADREMYRAKRSGKNRVSISGR